MYKYVPIWLRSGALFGALESEVIETTFDDPTPKQAVGDGCLPVMYKSVPIWLQCGDLFRALDPEDIESFDVPTGCYKSDDSVSNLAEFAQVLRATDYWLLDVIPQSLLDFCAANAPATWINNKPGLDRENKIYDILVSYFCGSQPILTAFHSGHDELVSHWMNVNAPDSVQGKNLSRIVASAGNVALLEKVHQCGYPWASDFCEVVLKREHLTSGHFACLKYACGHGCPLSATCCDLAVVYGRVEYAHQNGCELTDDVTLTSNIHCLTYALENNCPIHPGACFCAANNRYSPVDCLRRLRDVSLWLTEVPTGKLSLVQVIPVGIVLRDIDYFKYAMYVGCPYDDTLMVYAARENKVEQLRYLVEDMLLCPSDEVFTVALRCGNLDCVEYLVDKGCSCEFTATNFTDADYDDARILECIQYTLEHGRNLSALLHLFVSSNPLPLCQVYLLSFGCNF